MGVVLWWVSLGLNLAIEKELCGLGPNFCSVLIETERKDLWALPEVLDTSRGMIRHVDVRKLVCANRVRKWRFARRGVACTGMDEKVSPALSGVGEASLLDGPFARRNGLKKTRSSWETPLTRQLGKRSKCCWPFGTS